MLNPVRVLVSSGSLDRLDPAQWYNNAGQLLPGMYHVICDVIDTRLPSVLSSYPLSLLPFEGSRMRDRSY
jgi:hypothetical protein